MRILICDDHTLIREAITNRFTNEPNYYLVGEAENGYELIQKYELLKPDLVITDISMPGLSGIDAAKQLKSKYPGIKVLFISINEGEDYIYSILQVGGLGLISKDIKKGELLFAIDEVYHGRHYFGPGYNEHDIKRILKEYSTKPVGTEFNPERKLTDIEEKILEHLSNLMSTAEIAKKLEVSPRTIDSHRSAIIHKYDLKNGLALVSFAIFYMAFKRNNYKPILVT